MTDWLLVRGRGDKPPERHVDAAAITRHASSRRPQVESGDRAILYAAVWQAIFSVGDVVDDPEHNPERERWAWSFRIHPRTVVADLDRAPAVEEAGIFLRRSGATLTSG